MTLLKFYKARYLFRFELKMILAADEQKNAIVLPSGQWLDKHSDGFRLFSDLAEAKEFLREQMSIRRAVLQRELCDLDTADQEISGLTLETVQVTTSVL